MARRRKLIAASPFADVKLTAPSTTERQRFITRETVGRILAACNPTWRLIVILSRYGGLRCPSEVLSLRWQGVDWEAGRITVDSPKGKRHGKGTRVIPMFPELRPELETAWDLASEGAVYVVDADNYRAAAQSSSGWRNANLRTQFGRILKRAGVEAWPRLFHNLRASRETELAADFPIHVVTSWLGNTPRIAMKHYLQTTDADFERAAHNPAQPVQDAICRNLPDSVQTQERQALRQITGDSDLLCQPQEVEVKGFEPSASALRTLRSPN